MARLPVSRVRCADVPLRRAATPTRWAIIVAVVAGSRTVAAWPGMSSVVVVVVVVAFVVVNRGGKREGEVVCDSDDACPRGLLGSSAQLANQQPPIPHPGLT